MQIIEQLKLIVYDQIPTFIGFLTIPTLIEYTVANFILKIKTTYKDAKMTIAIGLIEVITTGLASFQIYPIFKYFENYSIFTIKKNYIYWISIFILAELVFYIAHYFSHKVRWFWNEHRVHHSSKEMNLFVGNRNGWTFMIAGMWFFAIPAVLLGFSWDDLNWCLFFILNYQFFVHTELIKTIGPLEKILNTPSIHRVHHAIQAEYLDKNFGGITLIFDYLFNTLQREIPGKPPIYGLDKEEVGTNLFRIVFAGWIEMYKSIKNEKKIWRKISCLYNMKINNFISIKNLAEEQSKTLKTEDKNFRISVQ